MITIENYEEYFLLYVDNELTPELRSAVERFVADHPQIAEELEAMLQCRLRPDPDHSFPDKTALLRKPEAWSDRAYNSHEESLIRYVDNELNKQEKAAVETLAQQHPSVAEELKRFQLTVNHPDTAIVFAGKEKLYRYEKGKRVIGLPWLRAGVAAVVLAAAALLLLPRGHKETAQPVAAAKKVPDAVTLSTPRTLNIVKKEEKIVQKTRKKKADYAVKRTRRTSTDEEASSERSRQAPKESSTSIETMIAQTQTVVDTGNRSAVAVTTPVKQMTQQANSVAVVYIPKDKSSFASEELEKEARETDDRAILTAETGGKNKLRGIFRRVSRALGKTAERDDQGQREVLISAFQVALK